MKRILFNLIILSLIVYFALILVRIVQEDGRIAADNQQLEAQQADLIAPLLSQRQKLEAELNALETEIQEAMTFKTLILPLMLTIEGETAGQAAAQLDGVGFPALLAVRPEDLAAWAQSGVPAFVAERLERGWALCPAAPGSEALSAMIAQLEALSLPAPAAVYFTGESYTRADEERLHAAGVEAVIHSGLKDSGWPSALVHVQSIGCMDRQAVALCLNNLGKGESIAYLIGGSTPETLYAEESFASTCNYYRYLAQNALMLPFPLEDAVAAQKTQLSAQRAMQSDWQKRETRLKENIDDLNARIQMISPAQ